MKACAYVVGPPDGPGAALMDMARGLGFEAVLPYGGVARAELQAQQTPICFFLFATVADVRSLKNAADAVRFSPSRKIRFSPLIYFTESPSVETIKRCIGMGFDDVITLPFMRSRVEERIQRQIDRPCVYYETSSYFGPDRRNRIEDEIRHPENRGGGQYRRLEIVRNLTHGVNVLRDDYRSCSSATYALVA